MIDVTLKIALTVRNNPGKFALLIGSGLSQSAGIPTGVEVVRSILSELARASGVDTPDPTEWYRLHFGEDPNYSRLLEKISQTRTERKGVLQKYYEATPEERAKGVKVPTAAHRAIASLVLKGYFRMIVTTNFDRLLEKALEEEGVIADVVSTEDAIWSGALNYIHSACTIWKINGDYKDARIRNLSGELEAYPEIYDKYFERLFEDFGLIICGWSANYDVALRKALIRFSKKRYGLYFCQLTPATQNENAASLVSLLGGEFVPIKSGDAFFQELKDKVVALEEGVSREPFSERVAVRLVQEYATNSQKLSLLNLLFQEEMQALYSFLSTLLPSEPTRTCLRKTENACRKLTKMLGYLVFAASSAERDLLIRKTFRTFLGSKELETHHAEERLRALLDYPTLLFAYGVGIMALEKDRYAFLFELLHLTASAQKGELEPLFCRCHPDNVYGRITAPGSSTGDSVDAHKGPFAWHYYLRDLLWDFFQEHFVNRTYYERIFNLFEFFVSLLWTSREFDRTTDEADKAPLGVFAVEANTDPRQMAMISEFVSRMRETDKSPIALHSRFWTEWRHALIDPMEHLLRRLEF